METPRVVIKIISIILVAALGMFISYKVGIRRGAGHPIIVKPFIPYDNNALAEYVKVSGYHVLAPAPNDNSVLPGLSIYNNDNERAVSIDNGMISITFNMGKANSYSLSVSDPDKKGIYDVVHYEILDNFGKAIGHVIDLDRDGQPEIKRYWEEGRRNKIKSTYFYVEGYWHIVERRGKSYYANVGGIEHLIERRGRKYYFGKQ